MICNNCKKQKGDTVFTLTNHSIMSDLKHIAGMCFDCFDSVPRHIPITQKRKFLERKVNGN